MCAVSTATSNKPPKERSEETSVKGGQGCAALIGAETGASVVEDLHPVSSNTARIVDRIVADFTV